MIKRKLIELINAWAKSQKTKIGETAREEINEFASNEVRQAARLGQNLVVMELK